MARPDSATPRNGWAWLCAFGGADNLCSGDACCGFAAAPGEPAAKRSLAGDAAFTAVPTTSPIKGRFGGAALSRRGSMEISAYDPRAEQEAAAAAAAAETAAAPSPSRDVVFVLDEEEELPAGAVPSPTRLLPGGASSLADGRADGPGAGGGSAAEAYSGAASGGRGLGPRAKRAARGLGKALSKLRRKQKQAAA